MSVSAALPYFPPPVAHPGVYAPDDDKAERASSSIQALSTSSTLFTEKDDPPSRKTSVRTKRSARVKTLWNKHRTLKEEKKKLYSAFKQKKVSDYPEGYPQLAALLNSADNLAILRRFGTTSARVLLHLQAEISSLENELAELDRTDAKDSSMVYRLRSQKDQDKWDGKQKRLVKALREKLSAYYDLLLKDTQMRALGKPIKEDYHSVLHWISGERPVVEGEDEWILQSEDLVPLTKVDRFESSLASSFLNRLFATSKQEGGITHFSEARITFAAKLISVLLAICILIIPVLVLFLASLSKIWMSATLLLSVLTFSATLCFFSEISVQEVLVGSAAYCAVLSAFLGI